MTREEVTAQIMAALASAPKTAPRAMLQALRDAGQFIEDQATQPPANDPQRAIPPGQSMAAPPGFLSLARQCAAELEEAAALKVGVMDSESRAAAIAAQRLGAIESVAARLREIA